MMGKGSGLAGRRLSRRLLIGIAVAVLALAFGGWRMTRPSDAADAMDKGKDVAVPPLVTVVVPSMGNVATTVSLTGQISAQNDMPIGVEGDGGRVAAVLVEPGDRVKRGQVLARLNPFTAQSQVESAQASLDELQAAAAASQAEYVRAEKARDAFSVEEFERRRTAAVTAVSKARAAEAQLSEAHTRWQRTTVVAPSDGIVLTRAAEVGQIAMPGAAPLFRLARDGAIEMRGEVAEQDMPRLKVGQVAMVRWGLSELFKVCAVKDHHLIAARSESGFGVKPGGGEVAGRDAEGDVLGAPCLVAEAGRKQRAGEAGAAGVWGDVEVLNIEAGLTAMG